MEELSEVSRALIRSYMIKVVTPSALAVSLVSGFAGFAINESARGAAYADAYSKAISSLVTITDQASTAASTAKFVLADITLKKEVMDKAVADATAQREKIASISSEQAAEIARGLLQDDQFRGSIAKVNSEELVAVAQRTDALEVAITPFVQASAERIAGSAGNITECPEGYYVVGINFVGAPGGAHGVLQSGTVTCQRVRLVQ